MAKMIVTTPFPEVSFGITCADRPEVRAWLKANGVRWNSGSDIETTHRRVVRMMVRNKIATIPSDGTFHSYIETLPLKFEKQLTQKEVLFGFLKKHRCKGKYLKGVKDNGTTVEEVLNISQDIAIGPFSIDAIRWGQTEEGFDFWNNIYEKWKALAISLNIKHLEKY